MDVPRIPGSILTYSNMLRPDGTKKGKGFLGELQRPDGGISTELSIGVDGIEPNKEIQIPTLVPGISEEQKQYLLATPVDKLKETNPAMWKDIVNTAIKFALKRKATNKPYFAE